MCGAYASCIQTVDRAFAILRALASRPDSSSLSDVARATDLPKTTTLRLLTALENLAMVERIGGRYTLGPGLATINHDATPASSLRDVSRPHLVELAERFGEHTSLAVADGDAALYVDTAPAESAVQVQDWTGERVPFHAAAAGLALMSTWSDDELAAYAARGLAALTPSTVSTLAGLRSRMAEVRRVGHAWTRAEFSDEVNGVAAPVIDRWGRAVGAITSYGPVYRFPGPRSREDIADPLIAACRQVGSRLDPGS